MPLHMATPHLTIRPGNPDFLDLPWEIDLTSWDHPRLVELPTGVHRHPVRFVAYRHDIYAIKELPRKPAVNEFESLREMRRRNLPTVDLVGIVERDWVDPTEEWSTAVITRYLDHGFSYRELISGGGFGARRTQMLDAFAGLLVELHIGGCFWGDCSLSNVLYRYDAEAIEVTLVDAETVEIHDELSDGQRSEDIQIMIENVAGGMADIAAEQGTDLDNADLHLGEDIARRYAGLWHEITSDVTIRTDERYKINERISRINDLGFEVGEVEMIPTLDAGESRLRLHFEVGGRNYHQHRLKYLTGIDASENQARQILSDLRYFEAKRDAATPSQKSVAGIQWRAGVFEPLLRQIEDSGGGDPIQAYCDFLNHRYILSYHAGRDIPTEEAFEDWISSGRPGISLDQPTSD